MRWNKTGISYSRPLRWLVALYGPDVIPFTYAGVASSRMSRGLRAYNSPEIPINDARNYLGIMRNNRIVVSSVKRQQNIYNVASKLAAEKKGYIPKDSALLEEVANLVERATPLRGKFDKRFLALPAEVLIAVMHKHQRYFPVYHIETDELMPIFLAVRNGDEKHLDIVVEGNEQVLKARFADAEFFYGNDIKHNLADFLPKLEKLTFQADLGSMLDKVHRLEKLTPIVAAMLGLSEEETAVSARAASLSKADLASSMVIEMTSLQGFMGGHYAKLSGEKSTVCAAIAEQYAAVSQTKPGMALAVADRLDSLVGLFAAGFVPKGSNDPFAMRRAALHLIENLIHHQCSFNVRIGLQEAAKLLPLPHTEAQLDAVLRFMNGRLDGVLREQGIAKSVVAAILAEQGNNPYLAARDARSLSDAMKAHSWSPVLDAYARCVRITRDLTEHYEIDADRLTVNAE